MDTLFSLLTYIIMVMICYGVAYLLSADVADIIAYVALAIAIDQMVRVD